MRQEVTRALYEGSLAESGDRNPYNVKSLVLAKLWLRGYLQMLSVRIETGPAMQTHLRVRLSGRAVEEIAYGEV